MPTSEFDRTYETRLVARIEKAIRLLGIEVLGTDETLTKLNELTAFESSLLGDIRQREDLDQQRRQPEKNRELRNQRVQKWSSKLYQVHGKIYDFGISSFAHSGAGLGGSFLLIENPSLAKDQQGQSKGLVSLCRVRRITRLEPEGYTGLSVEVTTFPLGEFRLTENGIRFEPEETRAENVFHQTIPWNAPGILAII